MRIVSQLLVSGQGEGRGVKAQKMSLCPCTLDAGIWYNGRNFFWEDNQYDRDPLRNEMQRMQV